MNTYKTLLKSASAEITEKKSRFIAYVKPIQTEESALMFINEIKNAHWDARHNVYAYVIKEENIRRYSDDGEPHGTAGMPILQVLKVMDLVNALVVVTRYFGGILLGTGGLVRAYSKAAQMAINAAGIAEMAMCCKCEIICPYDQYGKILNIISENGGCVNNTNFKELVTLSFYVVENLFNLVENKISEVTSGKIKIRFLKKEFINIKSLTL